MGGDVGCGRRRCRVGGGGDIGWEEEMRWREGAGELLPLAITTCIYMYTTPP